MDLEFNSLHNQREAAENYVKSQKHLGWKLVNANYDDGGYSGGNINRPALKKLKEDIISGKIDIVIVYKIDRLSRSLQDFVNLSTFFNEHGVSFISVTQQIDTESSMGKLMLNILLSFAQFEREMTSDRIKDKIAAAKKKGLWTGGILPIGYSSKDKKLIKNKDAKIIQEIFEKIADGFSTQDLVLHLNKYNILTNKGVKFYNNRIYGILNNQIYLGKVSHQGKYYEGKHKGFISKELWDKAHNQIKSRPTDKRRVAKYPGLLKGLVFCRYCNCAMTPNYAKKKNNAVFRYYTCMSIIRYGSKSCHLKRVNSNELENIIEKEILKYLKNPEISINFLNKKKVEINKIEELWQKLPFDQKQIIAKEVIKNIFIDHFYFKLTFQDQTIFNYERIAKKIILSNDATVSKQKQLKLNQKIRALMQEAIRLNDYQEKGLSIKKIAILKKISKSQTARILSMNNLHPEIQEKILSPYFPYKLKVSDFHKGFPKSKNEQLKWFKNLLKS